MDRKAAITAHHWAAIAQDRLTKLLYDTPGPA